MKTNHASAVLLMTGLSIIAVSAGCEEKKSEPAKAITDAAKDAGAAAKDAAAKTGEAVKDAGTAVAEKAKEAAPAPAPAPAPDMTAMAMEKIDAGMKTARTTLDELKKKAETANPLVKAAASGILTEAESKYSALAGQVKALTGTDGAAREKAIGEVTAGLGQLNDLLASAKSKLGM